MLADSYINRQIASRICPFPTQLAEVNLVETEDDLKGRRDEMRREMVTERHEA